MRRRRRRPRRHTAGDDGGDCGRRAGSRRKLGVGALLGRFRKGVAPQLLTQLLGGVHSIFGERASERVECRSRSIAALLGPSIQYGILPLPRLLYHILSYPP